MTFKKAHVAAVVACGLLSGSLVVSIASTPPRIMVLHAYATDYVWTSLVNQSIRSTFKKADYDVKIRYFYMDTRSLNYRNQAHLVEETFVQTVQNFNPEVIIAVDDAAQRLISRNYLNHPDIAVVFAGVNFSVEQYGYADARNITGMFEHKHVSRIIKVIEELKRMQKITETSSSVLFLADDSTSSHNNARFLADQDWGEIDYRGAIHTTHFADWKSVITNEAAEYDYILVSGYRQLLDEKGDRADSKDVATWTQRNSRGAVIGMNVFNSEDGIMLSVGVSPYEQGAEALKTSLRIIRGDSPDEIPYRYPKRYILALSEESLYDEEVKQNYKKVLIKNLAQNL